MWTAIGLIGSAIIAGAASAWSTHSANEANKDLTNNTNDQSIELANTQHQREVADLKAAGLNPILSAGGQGSAVPTLTPPQVSGYGDSINSAMSVMRPLITGEIENKASSTAKNLAEIKNIENVGKNLEEQNRLLKTQQFRTMMETLYPGFFGSAARTYGTAVNTIFGGDSEKNVFDFVDDIFGDRSSAKSLNSKPDYKVFERALESGKALGEKWQRWSPNPKKKRRSFPVMF